MKGGAAMKSFVANQIVGLHNGETILLFPNSKLVYYVDSDNNVAITKESLRYKVNRNILKLGDPIYIVMKINDLISMKIGRLSKVYI